ncbi:hypothetical protein SHKM778_26480 [Streptomyces sp. KM77-8]|uniref:HTH gntR-type domain-containing protein n=1 Tax=Streptomyces haneummycinicus TaxID=3074435 RepID=A0AAT9HGG6_9ACTN
MSTDVSSAQADTGAPGRIGRVPKYYRIKQRLLQMTDERAPGAPMPAERLLAVEFRTSRTTIRRALQELVGEGRLDRIQGKGTFVARPKVSRTLQLTSYTEDMRAQGLHPTSEVLEIGYIAAGAELAALLEVEPRDKVLRIERLRLAGGEPMAIEATHLSDRRFPGCAATSAGTPRSTPRSPRCTGYGRRRPTRPSRPPRRHPGRRGCSPRTWGCRCCCCPVTRGTRPERRWSGSARCTGGALQIHGDADAAGSLTGRFPLNTPSAKGCSAAAPKGHSLTRPIGPVQHPSGLNHSWRVPPDNRRVRNPARRHRMAESSHPRLLRWAHSVLQPGFGGTTVPDWVRRRISEGLASVVLFGRNIHGPEQVAALTAALYAENLELVVAVDEEAGDVTRLEARTGASRPGNLALGTLDDIDVTEQVARDVGRELHGLGITLNYAPSADVNTNPLNPVIGVRSFGARPDVVSRHAAAWVRGLQSAGVAACAKHFPGHGDTVVDSHLGLPRVSADARTLALTALPLFIAAMDAGVRAVMTAHLLVPAYDDRWPATLSRPVMGDLLRGELGFTGLIVTDAVEMGAVADRYGVPGAAVRAVTAGADAVSVGGGSAGEETTALLADALVDAVLDGRLPERRIAEAAGRVEEFAAWAAALRRDAPGPSGVIGTSGLGLAAARRAVRVHRRPGRDSGFPLVGTPHVVELSPRPPPPSTPPPRGAWRNRCGHCARAPRPYGWVNSNSRSTKPSCWNGSYCVRRTAVRWSWWSGTPPATAGCPARSPVWSAAGPTPSSWRWAFPRAGAPARSIWRRTARRACRVSPPPRC